MNIFRLFIAPLLFIPFFMGCNKEESVKFELSSEFQTVVNENSATIYIDWKPSDHLIKFNSFAYDNKQGKENTISFDGESEARPFAVTITFSNIISENIDGTLNFTYEDITTKAKRSDNISLAITTPYLIDNRDAYEKAIALKDIEYMQAEELNGGKKTTYEFSPNVYHMCSENTNVEKYVIKEDNNTYNKYSREIPNGQWEYEENVDEGQFLKPDEKEINPKAMLDLYTVYYEMLKYDLKKAIYTASYKIEEIEIGFKLKFKNKKIIYFEIVMPSLDGLSFTYAYEEKTPIIPERL